ncbi:MAG TPA: putative Ig domain-containing protein, partial [Armatimonadota bacterium]|nr:putative Ig domain-containing protein [Armatimonadota bacterium]
MATTSLILGPIGLMALVLAPADSAAQFIDTWLVAGPFANDAANTAFDTDHVGVAAVWPQPGDAWRVFDDRVFSRNYDDYQDLHSCLTVVRGLAAGPAVMYAHTYVFSESAQSGELRMGADNEHKVFVNGSLVGASTDSHPWRDSVAYPIGLDRGWNRLMIQVGNQEETRLGFYARLCAADGSALPGLTYALAVDGPLAVAHAALPAGFREWPYVALDPMADPDPEMGAYLTRKPHHTAHASPFRLAALGGQPPYAWSMSGGDLPSGLRLADDGVISGTVARDAPLGEYRFRAAVTDAAGSRAEAELMLPVRERPNKWYEDARLVALMHNPESILQATDDDLDQFADLMKRQGYALGMMISYNNGDFAYRWPSSFEPDNPRGDLAGRYKAALEAHGVKFGMYMGNLIGPNHGGDNGAIRMVEEAVVRYKPAALWFDWASPDPDGYVSLDALYSMIRVQSPETVIVLNGVQTLYQGDWDVVCVEGWGAWGDKIWATWPFELKWPKRVPVETWRMLADPGFEYSRDIAPDWQEYLRVQLTIIGQGFVANMDHSPTIATPYRRLAESVVAQAHMAMADWASPPGIPPLYES